METMQDAMKRLYEAGYRTQFRAGSEGFADLDDGRVYPPEALTIDELVRFEGASDPNDEAVLLALRSLDGSVRGTLASSFGPGSDPVAADLIRRLDDSERRSDERA